MNKKHWSIAAVVVLMLLFGAAWAMGMFHSDEAALNALKAKAATLMGEEGQKLTPEQRRKGWEELRAEAEKLPPEQRRLAMQAGRQQFQQRMNDHIAEFFKLPKEKQLAALDKDIKRMEEWQKARERRRGQRNGKGRDRGNSGSNAGGASGAMANASGGQGGPRRGGRTEAQRNERRKRMLDNTTPEQRAQFREYRRMMAERRKQLGLAAGTGRW
jgi:hypothetical protein